MVCSIMTVFCRFGFPRPVRYAPKLNPLKHALKRRHGRIEKLYHLERSPKEMMVNDYNPLLLYLWYIHFLL